MFRKKNNNLTPTIFKAIHPRGASEQLTLR